MKRGWSRPGTQAFAILALLLGALYVYGGYFAILTAMSLRRSPPPPELGVVSPRVLLGIGAVHSILGSVALCAGVGLALAQPWAVRVWQLTSTAIAAEIVATLLRPSGSRLSDFVVAGVVVCMCVASWTVLGKGRVADAVARE